VASLLRLKSNWASPDFSLSAGKLLSVNDESVAAFLLDREICDAAGEIRRYSPPRTETLADGTAETLHHERIAVLPASSEERIKKAHLKAGKELTVRASQDFPDSALRGKLFSMDETEANDLIRRGLAAIGKPKRGEKIDRVPSQVFGDISTDPTYAKERKRLIEIESDLSRKQFELSSIGNPVQSDAMAILEGKRPEFSNRSALESEIAALREAVKIQKVKVAEAKEAAIQRQCESLLPEHRQTVREIAESMVTFLRLSAKHDELFRRLENSGLAGYLRYLRPMHLKSSLGSVFDFDSLASNWLREAATHRFLTLSDEFLRGTAVYKFSSPVASAPVKMQPLPVDDLDGDEDPPEWITQPNSPSLTGVS
jgi:hypothetical protein